MVPTAPPGPPPVPSSVPALSPEQTTLNAPVPANTNSASPPDHARHSSSQVTQPTGNTAQEHGFLKGLHYIPAVLRTAPSNLQSKTKCV